MSGATYVTCCVNSTAELITPMVEQERQISRRTFLAHVDRESLRDVERSLSYDDHPRRGLTMAGDWHVGYYKSRYGGRPCVFFRHSHIEYIFQERQRP